MTSKFVLLVIFLLLIGVVYYEKIGTCQPGFLIYRASSYSFCYPFSWSPKLEKIDPNAPFDYNGTVSLTKGDVGIGFSPNSGRPQIAWECLDTEHLTVNGYDAIMETLKYGNRTGPGCSEEIQSIITSIKTSSNDISYAKGYRFVVRYDIKPASQESIDKKLYLQIVNSLKIKK